jgi:hypothetical protein
MQVGLDIAKSVFQIHGVDAAGNVIVRRAATFCHSFRSCRMRAFDRDLIRGGHYGQRPCVPR